MRWSPMNSPQEEQSPKPSNTYVLVGSGTVHSVTDEFGNIQPWATKNHLKNVSQQNQ